jgi:hypothetical protein
MRMLSFSAEKTLRGAITPFASGPSIDPSLSGAVVPQLPREGDGCGTTCQSGDGTQSCCCGVDEKCVTTLHTCSCQAASGFSWAGSALFGRGPSGFYAA